MAESVALLGENMGALVGADVNAALAGLVMHGLLGLTNLAVEGGYLWLR